MIHTAAFGKSSNIQRCGRHVLDTCCLMIIMMMLLMELRTEGEVVMFSCGNERSCCYGASHYKLDKSWLHIVGNREWHQLVHIHDISMVLMLKVMKVRDSVKKRAWRAYPSQLD